MNAPEKMFLPDVQSNYDSRNLAIQRVGIKDLSTPVQIEGMAGVIQPSVAKVDMFVALAPELKGTHMSRFIEVLQLNQQALSVTRMQSLMQETLSCLEAEEGLIEFRMPYFVKKIAPVSGAESLMDYLLSLRAECRQGQIRVTQKICVPVTSLCPCSKKISAYGAHNQRSHITISAELTTSLAPEQLILAAEKSASSQVYGILKRPDEKFVTEQAYDNPKFVEDLVRDVALVVQAMPEVIAAQIEAENFEAIHNHSAYAMIEFDKRQP
jgi:GTP cyclohydrolase I